MALRNPLTGKPHTKPGPDHSWRIIYDLKVILFKLGIKSAKPRARHPYEIAANEDDV
jgi:hypothetical protein